LGRVFNRFSEFIFKFNLIQGVVTKFFELSSLNQQLLINWAHQ